MKRVMVLKIAVLLGVTILSGCAKNVADQTETPSAAPASVNVSESIVAETEEQRPALAYLLLDGSKWSLNYAAAGRAKCEELGIKYLEYSCVGNAQTQIEQVQTCIDLGVTGVAIQSVSNESLAPILKEATEAGIMVISCADMDESLGLNDLIYFTVYDDYQAGCIVGEELLKHVSEGQYAVIGGVTGSESTSSRKQGINDTIGDKLECVVNADANGDAATAKAMTLDIIANYPGLVAILPVDDEMAAGVVEAIKLAGLEGQTYVGAIGASTTGVQMVKDGEMFCTVTYPVKWFAETQAQMVYNYINGNDFERRQVYSPVAVTIDNADDNFNL